MENQNKEILKFCIERGFLVDNHLLEIFSETSDIESVKLIIEKVKLSTNRNILTRDFFEENKEKVNTLFFNLPPEKQKKLEKLKIKLGLSIEISKAVENEFDLGENEPSRDENFSTEDEEYVNILYPTHNILDKKLEVKNFTSHFRNRFNYLKGILQNRPELTNLISIDKLSGSRQGISIIGIVYSKSVTRNKNMILEVEDASGKIKLLINKQKKELYETAEEICLDSVLGFKCSGSREILFVNDIFFPDIIIPERKKSPVEEYSLFIGDLHYGSKLFLKESFEKFIDYLNGKDPSANPEEIKKIKYLFITGDLVAGIGVYPNQKKDLEISDLEEQFINLSKLLNKIPKLIKIIISPGNHDGVRLMEPQPVFDEKYAWPLNELDNLIITGNPCAINFGSKKGFSGFNILTYHGFSYPYYANTIPSLILKRAMNCPEEIMKYLLKNRHLAPTHASTQYYPHEEDRMLIRTAPDFFVSGHTHKCGVSYYNNILIISTSCWEAMTSYQEKFGNQPDHCKVPMINLKTREVKILDFE